MSNEAAMRSRRRIAAQEKPAYSCMNCRVQKTLNIYIYRKSFMFFLVCTEHWPSNAENKNRTTERIWRKVNATKQNTVNNWVRILSFVRFSQCAVDVNKRRLKVVCVVVVEKRREENRMGKTKRCNKIMIQVEMMKLHIKCWRTHTEFAEHDDFLHFTRSIFSVRMNKGRWRGRRKGRESFQIHFE